MFSSDLEEILKITNFLSSENFSLGRFYSTDKKGKENICSFLIGGQVSVTVVTVVLICFG